jgi:hypothetical protein
MRPALAGEAAVNSQEMTFSAACSAVIAAKLLAPSGAA